MVGMWERDSQGFSLKRCVAG